MIPLKDNIPTRRFPIVTVALIVANVVVLFAFQHGRFHGLSVSVSQSNVVRYALIPYRVTHGGAQCGENATLASGQRLSAQAPVCEGERLPQGTTCQSDFQATDCSNELVTGVSPRNQPSVIATIFLAMFMHGGLLHIAGNMLFLWIFGNNIEDAMGRVKFLIFYLLGGVVAALSQTAVDPSSTVPTLGASGAIAAVLGGYALLYPRARVLTVVFIIFFFTVVELPALLVLLLWFGLQLLDSSAVSATGTAGGVAYFAHIGGFIFGLLFVRLFASHYNRDYDRPAPRAPLGPGTPVR